MTGRGPVDVEAVEVELLLEAMFQAGGVDFRHYARGPLRRRLVDRMEAEGVASLSALQARVLRDPEALARVGLHLSVTVTSMFRDRGFFRAFADKAVPLLRTYPFLRIWNAGCSTGEETYSLAILLREHGLAGRARLYATDINPMALERARSGLFPLDRMRQYTTNYIAAGGRRAFSEYYVADGSHARFDPSLIDGTVFAQHNLASDHSFNEFHVVICRNVLIYFGRPLQARAHELLHQSLGMFGILGLGDRESITTSPRASFYEELEPGQRLYRRVA